MTEVPEANRIYLTTAEIEAIEAETPAETALRQMESVMRRIDRWTEAKADAQKEIAKLAAEHRRLSKIAAGKDERK